MYGCEWSIAIWKCPNVCVVFINTGVSTMGLMDNSDDEWYVGEDSSAEMSSGQEISTAG